MNQLPLPINLRYFRLPLLSKSFWLPHIQLCPPEHINFDFLMIWNNFNCPFQSIKFDRPITWDTFNYQFEPIIFYCPLFQAILNLQFEQTQLWMPTGCSFAILLRWSHFPSAFRMKHIFNFLYGMNVSIVSCAIQLPVEPNTSECLLRRLYFQSPFKLANFDYLPIWIYLNFLWAENAFIKIWILLIATELNILSMSFELDMLFNQSLS